MKIILSRKGFDSEYGEQPSPILPDGTLLSLPIPSKDETLKFSVLNYQGKTYLDIIQQLKPSTKIQPHYACHLDPDIRKEDIIRDEDWLPLFGQTDAAQGHLSAQRVKEGDLFLFFGWFKQTEIRNGVLKYVHNAPNQHIIFGYIQIQSIYHDISNLPKRVQYHPHAQIKYLNKKNNCIYEATENLSFYPSLPGAGSLTFNENLVLTKKGYSRSKWDLPDFFKEVEMSYHTKASFNENYFKSAAKGQEFVIEENSEVAEWAKSLIVCGMV